MKDEIKSIVTIIEEVCEDICKNYCEYRNTWSLRFDIAFEYNEGTRVYFINKRTKTD